MFLGSSDDVRDGFVHLSTADQLQDTLNKHFEGQSDLVLLAIDTGSIEELIKWEAGRDGRMFPHLYAALPMDAVNSMQRLTGNQAPAGALE